MARYLKEYFKISRDHIKLLTSKKDYKTVYSLTWFYI